MRFANVQLLRAADFGGRVEVHFAPVGNPARQATDCEQHGEHARRKTHRLVNNPGVKVHVGVQLAFDELVIGKGDGLKLFGYVEQVVFHTERTKNLVGALFDQVGAGVKVFVDAVAEPH